MAGQNELITALYEVIDDYMEKNRSRIFYGTVIRTSPWEIRIDQKMNVYGNRVLVPKELSDLRKGERVIIERDWGGKNSLYLVRGRLA